MITNPRNLIIKVSPSYFHFVISLIFLILFIILTFSIVRKPIENIQGFIIALLVLLPLILITGFLFMKSISSFKRIIEIDINTRGIIAFSSQSFLFSRKKTCDLSKITFIWIEKFRLIKFGIPIPISSNLKAKYGNTLDVIELLIFNDACGYVDKNQIEMIIDLLLSENPKINLV